VYVTDDVTGNVFALRTVVEGANAAGTEAWRHATGDPSLSSPAIDSNGNVYVGDNNGDFTAISTWEAPVADGIGSGFATAPALADIVLDPTATNKGTLQVASVTLNAGPTPAAGTLRITFTGKASSSANIGVTVAGGGGGGPIPTPPAEGPVGSGYQTGETPTARVLADGIGDIIADITNPFSGPLSTGLAALIDGNANPAGGPVSNAGSGPDGTFDAAVQEPVHESADRRSGAGAFTFDGTDDKINLGTLDTQIGQNAATGAKNELTISAWVYHTDTGDDRIVCKSPDTNVANHIFSLGISTGDKVRMRIGTVTTPATTMDGGSIPLNEWTHVAMTYDGANVKSYVNGSLDSTHALTGNIKSSTTDDVYIGNVDNANNRHFKGSLDDIGIWNQALDASQIAEIAGPGNLTATTSVNDGSDLLKPAGTLTVTPVGTPAKAGKFFVEVDDGFSYFNNENNIGSGYATGETPAFTISGGGSSMTGNATVDPATGKLNIDLSSARPADATDRTLTVVSGTIRAPADLTGIGSGYTPGDTPPTVSISGGNKGTLAATATINDGISGGPPVPAAGTLNITFTAGTSPTDTNDVSLKIYDGVGRLSNLSGVGGNYASGETPAFTISGGGTSLLGTATVNDGISGGPPPPAAGTLNLDLSTVRTNDLTDRTLTIGSGAVRAPANLTGIGSGYTPGAPPPTVLISGANKGTLAATTTINDGISGGPPPPAAGTLNINFTAGTSPTDTNDVTIQIDDGVGHLANLSGVGSGYGTGETPAFTISGGGTNMTGTATVDPATGKLNVDLSNARPDDLVGRTLQIANGALQTPAPVTGIGAFHDPASPPTATISGADVGGVTVNTINVNSSGSVDVTFAGVPSGTGPLTVTVAGGSGTGGSAVSSKYLLDIDGDLWDYSVAEFESFTELVSDARAQNGAEQNSLGTFWDLLSTNVNKLEQAAGRIKDADFAKEMTELSKSQIINRSAAVMHGKQNRITSEALLTLQNLNNML
jgi:flagellin-like hook-associated protein FlgL